MTTRKGDENLEDLTQSAGAACFEDFSRKSVSGRMAISTAVVEA
jgi:hypothetical protein